MLTSTFWNLDKYIFETLMIFLMMMILGWWWELVDGGVSWCFTGGASEASKGRQGSSFHPGPLQCITVQCTPEHFTVKCNIVLFFPMHCQWVLWTACTVTYQLKVVERKDRRKQAKAALFSHCEAYTAPSNYIGQTHCSVTCSVSSAVWIVDCAIITVDTRGECSAEKSQGERLRCSVLTL